MNSPHRYEIEIEGVVSECWSAWFEDLVVRQLSDKKTIIRGELRDQAALLGVLAKIHALNLKIVSVQCSLFSKQ